jgi:hypothetical protein
MGYARNRSYLIQDHSSREIRHAAAHHDNRQHGRWQGDGGITGKVMGKVMGGTSSRAFNKVEGNAAVGSR